MLLLLALSLIPIHFETRRRGFVLPFLVGRNAKTNNKCGGKYYGTTKEQQSCSRVCFDKRQKTKKCDVRRISVKNKQKKRILEKKSLARNTRDK